MADNLKIAKLPSRDSTTFWCDDSHKKDIDSKEEEKISYHIGYQIRKWNHEYSKNDKKESEARVHK